MKVSANYLPKLFDKPMVDACLEAMRPVLESGDFTLGAAMHEFERLFSEDFVEGRQVFAVNSGTQALELALRAAKIGIGDEVVLPVNAFLADAGAVVKVGAIPRFCDVDASHQIDPAKIAGASRYKRPAVLAVWWYGTSPWWEAIQAETDLIIEDAAQAVGGSYKGRPSGTFGSVSAFSFHAIKPLMVPGDGGAVCVPRQSPKMGEFLRLYRDHGKVDRDHAAIWGDNARLQTILAPVLMLMMPLVKPAIERRQVVAARLDAELGKISGITIPERRGISTHRTYCIEAEDRDRLMTALRADGIDSAVYYPLPLSFQQAARSYGYGPGDFPNAERQARRQLALPAHEYITESEMEYMSERVRAFYA